ncbi:MAG: hypothetical protein HY690_08560, partial [Chloroflexi bacterium]|nr:hypothetical protein [Chloroflexota bacterium]
MDGVDQDQEQQPQGERPQRQAQPANNLVDAERLLLAGLRERRALAHRIGAQFVGWQRGLAAAGWLSARPARRSPALVSPRMGVALLAASELPKTGPARRESLEWGQTERYWWRLLTPDLALLQRRHARRLAAAHARRALAGAAAAGASMPDLRPASGPPGAGPAPVALERLASTPPPEAGPTEPGLLTGPGAAGTGGPPVLPGLLVGSTGGPPVPSRPGGGTGEPPVPPVNNPTALAPGNAALPAGQWGRPEFGAAGAEEVGGAAFAAAAPAPGGTHPGLAASPEGAARGVEPAPAPTERGGMAAAIRAAWQRLALVFAPSTSAPERARPAAAPGEEAEAAQPPVEPAERPAGRPAAAPEQPAAHAQAAPPSTPTTAPAAAVSQHGLHGGAATPAEATGQQPHLQLLQPAPGEPGAAAPAEATGKQPLAQAPEPAPSSTLAETTESQTATSVAPVAPPLAQVEEEVVAQGQPQEAAPTVPRHPGGGGQEEAVARGQPQGAAPT